MHVNYLTLCDFYHVETWKEPTLTHRHPRRVPFRVNGSSVGFDGSEPTPSSSSMKCDHLECAACLSPWAAWWPSDELQCLNHWSSLILKPDISEATPTTPAPFTEIAKTSPWRRKLSKTNVTLRIRRLVRSTASPALRPSFVSAPLKLARSPPLSGSQFGSLPLRLGPAPL